MPALRVEGFDGLAPRLAATALAPNQAQLARNVKLSAGELRFWRGPQLELAGYPGFFPKTIYKLYDDTEDPIWLMWEDDVDVVPGVLADTTEQRVYFTGTGTPRKTNFALATSALPPYPAGSLAMGVPAPATKPTVAITTAGTGQKVSRVYIYTYVAQFGSIREESAPSPPSDMIEPNTVGVKVAIGGFAPVPTGDYNITHLRIYRSVTGNESDSYQFVAELPIADTSYSDEKAYAELGEVCQTVGWQPPPDDLQGLCAVGQGVLAGFVGNTVYFCEPFYAHAWPARYGISLPWSIVAIGAFGSSLVVATEGRPFIIHGSPGAHSVEHLEMFEPCVSRHSLVSDEAGVTYASPNGLVTIGAQFRGVSTEALFRREEWQLEDPTQLRAAVYDNKYFAITSATRPAMILSRDDVPAMSRLDVPALAWHTDSRHAKLYYVDKDGGGIYEVDADPLRPLKFNWRSKRFAFPTAITFSALKVDADFDEVAEALSHNAEVARIQGLNADLWATGDVHGAMNSAVIHRHQVDGSDLLNVPPLANFRAAQILLYDGDKLMVTLTVGSWDPVRIPPFRSRELAIEIRGDVTVRSVTLGNTVVELQG